MGQEGTADQRYWKYNPSAWSQRIYIALGALFAAFIALYLGLYQWKLISTLWDPLFGQGSIEVLGSDVSDELTNYIRIPDAILGSLAYFSDAVFSLAGSGKRWRDHPWLVVLFGLDVIPLGAVSIILVILQGTVIGSWCFLCLVTATISLILIFLSYGEVFASVCYLIETWKLSKSFKSVWHTFCGTPSPEAYRAAEIILQRKEEKKNRVGKNH